jgi:hypothetical protein
MLDINLQFGENILPGTDVLVWVLRCARHAMHSFHSHTDVPVCIYYAAARRAVLFWQLAYSKCTQPVLRDHHYSVVM